MRPTRRATATATTSARTARSRWLVGLALLVAAAACGDGDENGDDAATASSTTSTAAPTTASTGTTGSTEPGGSGLSETATCADYVAATKPARENAARAALIVFRNDAGVEREPSEEVRAEFEQAVLEVCRGRQAAGMLDAMSAVAGVGQGTYLR